MRDALVSGIERHGGVLARNTPVERILLRDGAVAGVRTRAGRACSRRERLRSPPPTRRTPTAPRRGRAPPPPPAARPQRAAFFVTSVCLFLGTDSRPPRRTGMTDANIWGRIPPPISTASTSPSYRGELPDLDFFFLSSPSPQGPGRRRTARPWPRLAGASSRWPPTSRSPRGKARTMRRGEEYDALKQRLYDRYVCAAERFVPGLREHVKVAEVETPITNVQLRNGPAGRDLRPRDDPDQIGPLRFGTKGAFRPDSTSAAPRSTAEASSRPRSRASWPANRACILGPGPPASAGDRACPRRHLTPRVRRYLTGTFRATVGKARWRECSHGPHGWRESRERPYLSTGALP